MKWAALVIALAALVALVALLRPPSPSADGSPAAPPPAPRPADAALSRFHALMEQNQELTHDLRNEVSRGAGDAAVKPRLRKIRENSQAARALRYRPLPAENDELDEYFAHFLGALDELERAAWDAAPSPRLLKTLQYRCKVCHERWQN